MTVRVYGAIRMPDTYAKLHSMSKAIFLGMVALCASSAVAGDPRIMDRNLLTAALIVFALNFHQLFIGGLAAAPRRAPQARGLDRFAILTGPGLLGPATAELSRSTDRVYDARQASGTVLGHRVEQNGKGL
jgi:hypothetical protein